MSKYVQMQVQEEKSAVVPTGHWGTSVFAGGIDACPAMPGTPGITAGRWGTGNGWGRGSATPKQRVRRLPVHRVLNLKVPRVLTKNCLFSLQVAITIAVKMYIPASDV